MKSFYIGIYALFVTLCLGQNIPDSERYLGQTPPGITPKKFQLPVSSGLFAAERIAISPDGKEIYFSELNNYPPTTMRIKYFKYSNNQWNGPFNLFEGYMAPGLSLTGDTLFLEKLQGGGGTPYTYISLRNDSIWSVPQKFMPSSQPYKHYVQITISGRYYLSSNPPGSIGGLDWCRLVITQSDTTIESLGLPINTSGNDADFYVAKDDSYIIFSSFPSANRSCYGYLDLFITYRKNDNTWTYPKNLGTTINVNNPSDGRWGPYVTTGDKYLFYSRGISPADGGINWVRIDGLIDSLKHTNFVPYLKSQIPNQTDTVGRLMTYRISDTTFIDDDGNSTLSYTATLSNGSPLPAWLSFDTTTKTFSGAPTTTGTITIKVTAKDTANATILCQFTITVAASPTDVERNQNQIPGESSLLQNYPNPFNPSTTIYYSLKAASHITLTIYSILGKKICMLYDAFQSAGVHSLVWNGTDYNSNPVSSGIYLYQLEANGLDLNKKMILLR